MKRFGDFAQENVMDGDKKRLDDILNHEVKLLQVQFKGSKFDRKDSGNECMTMQIEIDGRHCIVFTGSGVLIDQARKYQAELPFIVTVKKIDRYYTFS